MNPLAGFSFSPSQHALQIFLVFAGLGWLYAPVLAKLVHDWNTNPNYSHGWFIPCISLAMMCSRRSEFRNIPIVPSNSGLFFLIGGLLLLIVARVGSELFLQRISLIPVLFGMSLFFYGTTISRYFVTPIGYLVFMMPLPAILWNTIAFPMQLFASAMTEHVVRFLGMPIYRQGNVLQLPETTLEVVDACSGMRSLTTMFALAAALAWFTPGGAWRRSLIVLSAAPIAVLINIVRLGGTAILARYYGEKVAQGFLHEFSGLLTFGLGIALLLGVSFLLASSKPKDINLRNAS